MKRGYFRRKFAEDQIKIVKVILGGSWGVGKTSIRKCYLGMGFEATYKQTFGADFALKQTTSQLDGTTITMNWQIWDIAGQPAFEKLRKMYIYGSHAALVVFDITRPETLAEAEEWCFDIWTHSGSSRMVPIVLVGNKIDLRSDPKIKKDHEILHPDDGLQLANKLRVPYIETSAKTGENINQAFNLLAQTLFMKDEY